MPFRLSNFKTAQLQAVSLQNAQFQDRTISDRPTLAPSNFETVRFQSQKSRPFNLRQSNFRTAQFQDRLISGPSIFADDRPLLALVKNLSFDGTQWSKSNFLFGNSANLSSSSSDPSCSRLSSVPSVGTSFTGAILTSSRLLNFWSSSLDFWFSLDFRFLSCLTGVEVVFGRSVSEDEVLFPGQGSTDSRDLHFRS